MVTGLPIVLDGAVGWIVLRQAWAQAATHLETIPGVGRVTAAWLLVATLNFTTCPTPKTLTLYASLAPSPHQSGTNVHGPDTLSRLRPCAAAYRVLHGVPERDAAQSCREAVV